MGDLISLIVLTYNSSDTIIETLESVAKQTYNNYEIIVSDDGSSDNTISVIKEWMNHNDMNITIITSSVNTGIPGNCNRALNVCRGSLYKLIAGDDLLSEDALEEYYNHYCKGDKDIIYVSKVELFGYPTIVQELYCKKCYAMLKKNYQEQLDELLISNYIIAPAVGLINVETARKLGGYDDRFPAFEDYPFYLKMMTNGFSFRLINKNLVRYRISNKSVSNGLNKWYFESLVNFFFRSKLMILLKHKMYFVTIKQIVRYLLLYIKIKVI